MLLARELIKSGQSNTQGIMDLILMDLDISTFLDADRTLTERMPLLYQSLLSSYLMGMCLQLTEMVSKAAILLISKM